MSFRGRLLSDPGFLGLVRKHIRSVWSLELLLLLRSSPAEAWRAEALVRELRASTPLIAGCLAGLQESGQSGTHLAGGCRVAPWATTIACEFILTGTCCPMSPPR